MKFRFFLQAFLIILFADILLGYHSEEGWASAINLFANHYGYEIEVCNYYFYSYFKQKFIEAISLKFLVTNFLLPVKGKINLILYSFYLVTFRCIR